MNIVLWVLQGLLALHTLMGAVWKFSNTEHAVPSLKAIPHGVWMSLSVVEIACAVGLVVPALYAPLAMAAPIAAGVIAAEMLLFSGVHLASSETNNSPVIYWLVVAALCGVVVYGRMPG